MSSSDKKNASYGAILKSSSIIGGSQAFSYAVGLARTKIVAVLLGPSGVGLIGIYNSIIALTFTVTGMGLGNSGVREISAARGKDDLEEIGQVQLALRRLAFILGGAGCIFFVLCAPWLSQILFQDSKYTLPIAIIGIILIFNGLKSTQTATIQGFRKISALAKATMLGTLLSSIVAIGFYGILGEKGIVPALITISALGMLVSWRYAKPLYHQPSDSSWLRSWLHSRRLLALGAALAWGALLGEMTPFLARALIVRDLGIAANGYYVAAWAISGLFIKFLLSAMWADFFPRLSEAANSLETRNRLVNEQTEVGIIVALPGVLAMTILAPLIIRILYTQEFAPAAELLPWFVLGLFGRITSWPMGMIVLAKGEATVQAVMQTVSATMHVAWLYVMFRLFSLQGLAMAFALHYVIYNMLLHAFLFKRYGFCWSAAVCRLLLMLVSFLLIIAVLKLMLPLMYYGIACALVIMVASGYSSFQLYIRIASNPKLEKLVAKFPKGWVDFLDSMVRRYG
ncbi:oligosaccharide flippase family protein [Opitutales bacterium]|nr:oligosaccharide flippase family protein [Opitutales bacterium]MDB2681511.1 oligosaccharide flippase family protein [Opitutales bacterium]